MRRRPGTGDSSAKKGKITGTLEVKGAGPTLPGDEAVLGAVGAALPPPGSNFMGSRYSALRLFISTKVPGSPPNAYFCQVTAANLGSANPEPSISKTDLKHLCRPLNLDLKQNRYFQGRGILGLLFPGDSDAPVMFSSYIISYTWDPYSSPAPHRGWSWVQVSSE